ncbi:MAG: tetratricopeptide repeat protein [Deltaproteobacteria bacterium]|nr:tetratricopeptide repeat protein [Deltaproteobacteria bacterium]
MKPLVGRDRELAVVHAWSTSVGRLLSIVGPPGVGKSRLARELRSPTTLHCALDSCRTAADVDRALQRALGRVSRARLPRAIAAHEGIIVLDRLEHLLDSLRPRIEEWLAAPGARFVVTTRAALGLFDEQLLHVGPLDVDEGVRLYRERAGRAIDEEVTARIVARLDGLPLAIELAAAGAGVLDDRAVLSRIERGVDGSLRATVGWSLDLLTEEERGTLASCAIFAGAFDAADASAVVGGADVVVSLVALERKNLLRRVEGGVVLYAAVREVALEELTRAGRLEELAARHAAHCLREPERMSAADLSAAERFVRDRDPLASATLAIAIDAALMGHAPSAAHVALLTSAIDQAARANDRATVARALLARARARRLRGTVRHAIVDLRRALATARGAGARGLEADALRLLGVTARQLSRLGRARVLLRSALAIQEELGHSRAAALTLDDLGVVAHDRGELAEARTAYERALSLSRLSGDRRVEGITLGHLGVVAHHLGDAAEALAFLRAALALHRETDERRFEGFAHAFIAAAQLEMGALEEARRSVEEALEVDARLGDVDSGAMVAGIACATHAFADRIVEARQALDRGLGELSGREDASLRRALEAFGWSLVVADARRARREGREDDATARRALVEDALARAPARCVEERVAHRLVRHMLEREGAARVASDGSWFEIGGKRVSLTTRRSLGLLLRRLAEEQVSAPRRSLSLETLFEAGWPGERVAEASARRRVYVAIDTLRTLGLGPAVVQRDRGYFLDPAARVVQV